MAEILSETLIPYKYLAAHLWALLAWEEATLCSRKSTMANSEFSLVDCKNLYAYLKTLPSSMLETLYKHPCPCMAIFRDLTAMAQQLLLRQLFIDQILAKSVVSTWITNEGKKDFDEAVRILTELKIWTEVPLNSGLMGWKLNEDFREGVQAVIVGGRDSWSGNDAGDGSSVESM